MREFEGTKKLALDCESMGNVSFTFVADSRAKWWLYSLDKFVVDRKVDLLLCLANFGPFRCSAPMVLYLHQMKVLDSHFLYGSPFAERVRLWLMRQFVFWSIRKSCAVVVQTDAMKSLLVDSIPRSAPKVHVISPIVETDSSSDCLRPEFAEHVSEFQGFKVCYVTSKGSHKNNFRCVAGFLSAFKNNSNARLLLTIEQEKGIMQLIQRCRGEGKVVFLGPCNRSEVMELLRQSDVHLFTSLAESFGLPLVESMRVGCPLALSDLPYAHEVVGDAGIYFDPYCVNSIADVLQDIFQNPSTSERLRKNASYQVTKFSDHAVAMEIKKLFKTCAFATSAVSHTPARDDSK